MNTSLYSTKSLSAEDITFIKTDGNPLWMMVLFTAKNKMTTSTASMQLR